MSETCSINSCKRTSRALCHCCQQNVCIIHLNEHNDILNSRLNPLVDTMKILSNRLQTINIQNIGEHCRQQLEQWRLDAQKKIEEFFKQKCQELDRLIAEKVDEQQEEISQLQSKLTKLIRDQQVTRKDIFDLTSTIDHLEKQIRNIEQRFVEIHTNPLVLNSNLINIRGMNEEDYDLSSLSSIYKIINRPDGSYGVLASNNRYLLIHQTPNLCLVDQDLTIHKTMPWRHGIIYDICWSVTLNQFIILNQKNLFLLDETTMTIEKIKAIEKRKWLSCTCSDTSLFLSTNEWGSSITKISLNSTEKFGQQWQSPVICTANEYIDVVSYNKGKLAMIIRSSLNNSIRIELRSSSTLDRIWSSLLDLLWNPQKPFHCCPFLDEDWLITDYETGRLLHITKTGKIKSTRPYDSIPYCATLFGPNILAVSTKSGINFHSLNHEKTYTIFVL